MTTRPSNQSPEYMPTQAAPWRTASPDVPTMAAYLPPAAPRQAYGQQPQLAWSTEQPEFNSAPATYAAPSWFTRSRVLTFGGGLLVAAAAAGLIGVMHGGSSSTPVNPTSQSAPAPAAAPAPMPSHGQSAHSYRSTSHSAMTSGGHSMPASHQAPSQMPQAAPSAPSGQSGSDDHNNGSDPSQWNHDTSYWFTHRRDHDSRWDHDHDSHWRSDHSDDSGHDLSSDGNSGDSK